MRERHTSALERKLIRLEETAVNIQIGFLCGVGFAIYLVEDMINPIKISIQPSVQTIVEKDDDSPKRPSRGSDGKTSSSSSQSSSASSSSKRTLTDAEKASLPTSTGKSKDKDKAERLPVSWMLVNVANAVGGLSFRF